MGRRLYFSTHALQQLVQRWASLAPAPPASQWAPIAQARRRCATSRYRIP